MAPQMMFRVCGDEQLHDWTWKSFIIANRLQARRYHDDLFAVLDHIAANPRMTRERKEISPPARIHPFKAHLIVYRIEENGAIFVIRIRHGREDWAGDPV